MWSAGEIYRTWVAGGSRLSAAAAPRAPSSTTRLQTRTTWWSWRDLTTAQS